jgi:ribonuclease BN (tRNA processing enzyme)
MSDAPPALMPIAADATPVRIRVLGCSGAIGAGHRTTSFLLDEHVLLDCGTGVGDLTVEAMVQIDDVVLTHSHLDHVLLLPLLVELVLSTRLAPGGRGAIRVHGLPETLEALRTHLFNGTIWPDFLRIPSVDQPILTLHPCAVGDVLTVGTGAQARRLWLLPAAHPVPACGIAVDSGEGWWVFTGDSGANPDCWALLASQRLAHVVVDVSFPDELADLAERSGHLTPQTLAQALQSLPGAVPVHVSHLKPGDDERVMEQVRAIRTPHRLTRLLPNHRFELAATSAVAPADR